MYASPASTVNVSEPVDTMVFEVVELVLYLSDNELIIGSVAVPVIDILAQAVMLLTQPPHHHPLLSTFSRCDLPRL
jgi:hypothetical protein